MYTIDLSGKTGLIFGVANKRSIAWAVAQILHEAGMRLAFTYQNERVKESVQELVSSLKDALLMPCDVSDDKQLEAVFGQAAKEFGKLNCVIHSVAYANRQDLDANREDLEGAFLDTSRAGFHTALDVSAYSLIPMARLAAPLMEQEGGSIVAMTYLASERVIPGYNVMGSAKAALEHIIRQLAYELGPKNIRVNGISAGPLSTAAARGIKGFTDMLQHHREKAPLKRNIEHREVAKTALFLVSDLSSGITGEIIYVDAGYNIMGV